LWCCCSFTIISVHRLRILNRSCWKEYWFSEYPENQQD
jgi:hypothetical protein